MGIATIRENLKDYAKGKATNESDVDLLVLLTTVGVIRDFGKIVNMLDNSL